MIWFIFLNSKPTKYKPIKLDWDDLWFFAPFVSSLLCCFIVWYYTNVFNAAYVNILGIPFSFIPLFIRQAIDHKKDYGYHDKTCIIIGTIYTLVVIVGGYCLIKSNWT